MHSPSCSPSLTFQTRLVKINHVKALQENISTTHTYDAREHKMPQFLYIYISYAGCLFEILNQFPMFFFIFLFFFLAYKEFLNTYRFHAETKIFNWNMIRHIFWANSPVGESTRRRRSAFSVVFLSSFLKICISAGTPNARVLPIKYTQNEQYRSMYKQKGIIRVVHSKSNDNHIPHCLFLPLYDSSTERNHHHSWTN